MLYRNSGESSARLGLAIQAKRVRTAPARNRLRRLIRESFRMRQMELAGLDIVVLPRDESVRAKNDRIFSSLASHWTKLAEARAHSPAQPPANRGSGR